MRVRIRYCFCAFILLAVLGKAQQTQLGADFEGESTRLKTSCGAFTINSAGSCAETLFTDHPLHIAVGSLPPGNGFGAGLAFVSHWTPNERWRLNFDADAIASSNLSWRAGGYLTAVYVPMRKIVVNTTAAGVGKKSNLKVEEYPVFHAYAQSISLEKLAYFGEGPNSQGTSRSYFGMQETIAGGNVVWPISWSRVSGLNASVLAEANSRTNNIRPSTGQASPSIEQLYTPATAPGLTNQPSYAQFGQGIRRGPVSPQAMCG
jgi:hypothetical protein